MKTILPKPMLLLGCFFLFMGGSLFAQPVNDDICNATALTVGAGCGGTTNGNNTGATSQAGEPNPSCFAGAVNTVWFSFVGPVSGRAKISTNYPLGTNMDTEIALYALSSGQCSNLNDLLLIACKQDDNTPPVIYNSTIEQAPVIPGETYYIAVSGWSNVQGSFCLTVDEVASPSPAPAANDTLCQAIALAVDSSCNGQVNGNNLNAFFEVGEPLGSCSSSDNTVWFSFVAPAAGAVEITTDVAVGGSNTQSELTLFALPGGNCSNPVDLFELACGSLNGVSGSQIDTTRVTPGQTYYVAVSGGNGSFCIEVTSAGGVAYPVNDNLCDAIPLGIGTPCPGNFSNTNATLETGEPIGSCFSGGANSVWFSFVGPNTGAVSITTDIDSMGTNDDTEISVYALPGGSCNNLFDLTELACSQDNGSVLPFNGFIEGVPVDSGLTYYVQVSGYNGTEGSFCIAIEEAFLPSNDDVCQAIGVPVDGNIYDYFNISASLEAGEDTLVNVPSGNGEGNFAWFENSLRSTTWHTFVAPSSGSVRIDLCNDGAGTTDFDTQLAVFRGDSCEGFSNFVFIGGNDDDPQGCTNSSNLFSSILDLACLIPGESYFILVDGFQNQSGFYSISITEIPAGPLSFTFDPSNPSCSDDLDGNIEVKLEGGSPPFSYLWSTGDTTAQLDSIGLGSYSLTVRDFCDSTFDAQLTLLPRPRLTASTIEDPVLCENDSSGQSVVIVGGGRAPYRYLWNTGDTTAFLPNQAAGNYRVQVTDACDSIASIPTIIASPTALMAEAGEDQFLCVGESPEIQLGGSSAATGGSPDLPASRAIGADESAGLGLFRHAVRRADSLEQIIGQVPAFSGADVADGLLYLMDRDSSELYSFDPLSSQLTAVGRTALAPDEDWVGLAYDERRSKLFGLGVGSNGNSLYEIDRNTAASTRVGSIDVAVPVWLAINPQGEMYVLDLLTDQLFQLDTLTLAADSVGPVGFDANFLQDADFDPETGLLYLAAFNASSNQAEYRLIDLSVGSHAALLEGFDQLNQVGAYAIFPQNNTSDTYAYAWEPNIGFAQPGDTALPNPFISYLLDTTYYLTVTDACGKVAVDSLSVLLNDDLSVDSVLVSGNSGSAFVSGGIPPYSYSWSNGETGPTTENLPIGDYSVIVTDGVGCTDSLEFSVLASLDKAWNFSELILYPNPNRGLFALEIELRRVEELLLKVYAIDGKLVYQEKVKGEKRVRKDMDLRGLPKGVYKLTLSSSTAFISRSLLIK